MIKVHIPFRENPGKDDRSTYAWSFAYGIPDNHALSIYFYPLTMKRNLQLIKSAVYI